MKLNFQYAIGIIAALSLLLGLSIGQLHNQHLEIEMLKQQPTQFKTVTLRPANNLENIQRYDKLRRCIDQEFRARIESERARVEREKARIEEIKAALREGAIKEVKRDKTHIILQEEL